MAYKCYLSIRRAYPKKLSLISIVDQSGSIKFMKKQIILRYVPTNDPGANLFHSAFDFVIKWDSAVSDAFDLAADASTAKFIKYSGNKSFLQTLKPFC